MKELDVNHIIWPILILKIVLSIALIIIIYFAVKALKKYLKNHQS